MDNKAKLMLKDFYDKFAENKFTENDVHSFLIFARENLPANSVLQEFSHFIAHRERNKGITFDYLKKLSDLIQDIKKLPQSGINVAGLYSLYEIQKSFNDFWVQFGYQTLPIPTVLDFILCMVSLLQEVPLVGKGKLIGKLTVTISSNCIELGALLDVTDYFKISTVYKERNPVNLRIPIIIMNTERLYQGDDSISTEHSPITVTRTEKGLGIIFNKDSQS